MLKFSHSGYWVPIEEAIYLDNENENHYNVVVSIEKVSIYQIQINQTSTTESEVF